ncbi:MAG: RIP metalloprotease RseP [Bacteroidia bacterium]|nr:RIP metalloprotease RseP [Bacteroidota bacterium]MBP9082184.1 RIP metalloprotease RseP [Bacteroidia bacterium]MBK7388870.1 RIP metalloprotease RseP [Bacteroidota bacterium]MBK8413921.1 RIP metalloprotease RseP [Bacteroidota bacterium]MBK8873347.1 RIP metalloprotease RseP [Bacteroidota bacterium]
MTGLIMAAQLILGLSILVALHELGHYLAARAFGIRVEKFYLFFDAWGFKLFSFTKGDTEYGIGWLPLGGYVKISGMIDESLDKDQLSGPPQPYEFRAKPAWQRLIVMVAGVTMNVILGIIIFSLTLLVYKKDYLPNSEVKNGIYAYKLGEQIGLQNGDKITAINGKSFERFDDLLSSRVVFGAVLTVERNGQSVEVTVPDNFYRTIATEGRWNFIGTGPLVHEVKSITAGENAEKAGIHVGDKIIAIEGIPINANNELPDKLSKMKSGSVNLTVRREGKDISVAPLVSDKGTIGIGYETNSLVSDSYHMKEYTFGSAFAFGTSDAMEALVSNIKGLKKIFSGDEKATDAVQGPIGIAQIYGGTWDWAWFWRITGLLSMVLAFMNILPIPALDGGHVIFLTIEAITRRKFSDQFMERSQIVGMVLLLALMVFAVGNDIWKHLIN